MTRLFFVTAAILFYCALPLYGCGYDFVGGCSSNVSLKINGTEGEFAIAPCAMATPFQGLQLGTIQSLRLSGANAITWESCTNNVSAVDLFYRVYKTGQNPGSWQSAGVPEDHHTVEGPYTTRYHKASWDVLLSAGLLTGSQYTLEVYFRAAIDTLGDDFIPETFIVQNNNSANYKLQFTYGGVNAPTLNAVVTKDINVDCWGGHTGAAGVSVFGGQAGGTLFYQWSAFTQNFYTIDSLPAGTYTVTVTDSPSGNSATASIVISQPQFPVMLGFVNIMPADCNTPGSATVTPSGGAPPLTWEWSNGDTTATTYFPNGGHYAITVTDSKGCTQKGMVNIPGNGSVSIFELPVICAGTEYSRGGQIFTQEGLYEVTIPAPNGCDTLVAFYLNIVPSAELIDALPTAGIITCAQPGLVLCAESTPLASYTWEKEGVVTGNSACFTAIEAGVYQVKVTTTENDKTCMASKEISVEGHLEAEIFTAMGIGVYAPPCGSGNVSVHCEANYSGAAISYTWYFNNNIISTADTCFIALTAPITNFPTISITDTFGCTASAIPTITFETPAGSPSVTAAIQHTQCDGWVEVNLVIAGGNLPLSVDWGNGPVGNPVLLNPGFYFVNITDASGCGTAAGIFVEEYSVSATSQPASNAGANNGTSAAIPDGAFNPPVSYAWNTGDTAQVITQLSPGTYCVTATDAAGCTRVSCTEVAQVSGTQPFNIEKGLLLYPVPAIVGGMVHISPFEENMRWELVGMDGRLYDEQEFMAGQASVNIPENIPEGVYLGIIKNSTILRIGKIFLQTGR